MAIVIIQIRYVIINMIIIQIFYLKNTIFLNMNNNIIKYLDFFYYNSNISYVKIKS